MTSRKTKGAPDGPYGFDIPPEAPPVARAVSICAAILEITGCVDLTDLDARLTDPHIRGLLRRAYITPTDQALIREHRGVLGLLRNTSPKTRLVICPKCGAAYLAATGGVPKTCQLGPAGCDGTPYACTPANRIPLPPHG